MATTLLTRRLRTTGTARSTTARERTHGVVMFTPTPNGGHARYSHELLSALAADGAGHPAEDRLVVSLMTSRDLDATYQSADYPIHAVMDPLKPRESFPNLAQWALSRLTFYWRRDRAFGRWVRRNRQIDAVHYQEFSPWWAWFDIRQLKRSGVKVFVTVHNVRWNSYPPLVPRFLPNLMNRIAWRRADGLFVHSETLRDELARALGTPHPPIFVTPHGAWKNEDARPAAEPSEIARRLKGRHLLFFGVVSEYKGVHVLLDAMKALPDFTLTIAGATTSERYRQELHTAIDALPQGQVTMIDRFIPDEDVASLFDDATLLILPYVNFAAQSGVLHDAIAMGVPVVATDAGALGESVRAWGIGEIATKNDVTSLIDAIRRMNDATRYTAAAHALDAAREELSWSRTAEQTMAGYRMVLHGN